jgi:8-oxo-dGTP pyrophosphatase MutT (NUDIX family)
LAFVKDRACDEYVKTLPRKRVAAGVLLRDENNRVVLVEPSYKENWEIPGGVVEADESPWSAAERELKEELGLVRRDMRVLVVDYVAGAPDGMPEGLLWIFDGGLLSAEECRTLRVHDDEVKSVELLSIEEAVKKTKDSLARRLRVALKSVLDDGATVYCDQGEPRRELERLSA